MLLTNLRIAIVYAHVCRLAYEKVLEDINQKFRKSAFARVVIKNAVNKFK